MAKKGVNLLEEDGEEREPDEEGGEAQRPSRRSGGGGGGLIRYLIIGAVALVLLGGGGWAGYTFWWVPSKKREAERQEAQKKLEELRQQRLAQLRAEAEQRKQALAIIEQVQAEQQGKAAPKPGEPGGEGGKPPAAAASVPPSGAKPPASPPQAGALKGEMAKPMPPAAPKPPAAPPQQMAQAKPPAAPVPGKQEGKPAQEVAPPKVAAKPVPEGSAPRMAQAQPRNGQQEGSPAAPRPAPPRERQARRPGPSAYSVQVATCRTDRCVQSFVGRLREKGLEARVSGGGGAGGPTNEVLLGSFASREEAENLAGQAQSKNLKTTIYESGGRWRVAAGSFRDLEDAAQMLDRAEDAGFRGELARRPGAPQAASGLRAVRTGSFATRQQALAERARVVGAGFQGAFVVAEPRR